MADNNSKIDWNKIIAFAPLFVLIIVALFFHPEEAQIPLSCKFLQNELASQQEFLAAFENETLVEQARAECDYSGNSKAKCYNDIVYRYVSSTSEGAIISAPMSTSFDDCTIYYEPYENNFSSPLNSDDQIESALRDFLVKRGGSILSDQVLEAYFCAILTHERKHLEQCLKDKDHYLTIDGHQEAEIEAYNASIASKQAYLENNCKIYCPCDNKTYSSQEACEQECPSGLGCFGQHCTVAPAHEF